jgi:microcystin-dependent protein
VSLIVLNAGEAAFLQNGVTGVAYVLRLYKADVTAGLTPPEIDALDETDFTEATFTGYSAAAVSTGGWTITQGNPTKAVNVEKQFTSSANQSAQNIWGYYVTRTSDGVAMWFEQYPAPVVIEDLNDRIDVIPTMTLDDAEGNGLEVGDIIPTARATAAPGRLLCQGQAVSRTTFAALFAAIGTAYGVGNGSTTFNVPNLQQRVPLGKATSGTGATLGDTGGTIDHVHALDTSSSFAKVTIASGSTDNAYWGRKNVSPSWNSVIEGNVGSAGGTVISQGSGVGLGGNSDTANPPFQVVNFEIVAS